MTNILLLLLLTAVFLLPFILKEAEEGMEYFLFGAGLLAVTITACWSQKLIIETLLTPLKITAAVIVCGIIFEVFAGKIGPIVGRVSAKTGKPFFVLIMIIILGLFSSIFTAIISALILSEVMGHMNLPRKTEINIVILACFAIGMGAVLTPVGEPLSTIVTEKLSVEPFNAGFLFLFREFWIYSSVIIILLAAAGAIITACGNGNDEGLKEDKRGGFKSIAMRGFKVYLFIAGLVLLGAGYTPFVKTYVSGLPHYMLYWINMVSAVLDNATLAAAEISPAMSLLQIKSAMLGLIISGGMLIPGNIPNIICAGKLGIKPKEWAKFAVPAGLIILCFSFIAVIFVHL
ncbi:MAG: DUF1646 family protein [Candidatus Goldiibacteriota bacterium]|jgi:predicted cation transporter